MSTTKNFRITICLNNFFNDHRSVCRVFISKQMKYISDLEAHVSNIFNIHNFHFVCHNQYLPSIEDIRIIQPEEVLTAIPKQIFIEDIEKNIDDKSYYLHINKLNNTRELNRSEKKKIRKAQCVTEIESKSNLNSDIEENTYKKKKKRKRSKSKTEVNQNAFDEIEVPVKKRKCKKKCNDIDRRKVESKMADERIRNQTIFSNSVLPELLESFSKDAFKPDLNVKEKILYFEERSSPNVCQNALDLNSADQVQTEEMADKKGEDDNTKHKIHEKQKNSISRTESFIQNETSGELQMLKSDQQVNNCSSDRNLLVKKHKTGIICLDLPKQTNIVKSLIVSNTPSKSCDTLEKVTLNSNKCLKMFNNKISELVINKTLSNTNGIETLKVLEQVRNQSRNMNSKDAIMTKQNDVKSFNTTEKSFNVATANIFNNSNCLHLERIEKSNFLSEIDNAKSPGRLENNFKENLLSINSNNSEEIGKGQVLDCTITNNDMLCTPDKACVKYECSTDNFKNYSEIKVNEDGLENKSHAIPAIANNGYSSENSENINSQIETSVCLFNTSGFKTSTMISTTINADGSVLSPIADEALSLVNGNNSNALKSNVTSVEVKDEQVNIKRSFVPTSNLLFQSEYPSTQNITLSQSNLESKPTEQEHLVADFVTKRKRTRHRKRKSKTNSTCDFTETSLKNEFSYHVPLRVAGPAVHIKFDDSDELGIDTKEDLGRVDKNNGSKCHLVNTESVVAKEFLQKTGVNTEAEVAATLDDGPIGTITNATDIDDIKISEQTILESPLMDRTLPKLGDLIAFKIFRLNADYNPEISDYIIGKVLCFDAKTQDVSIQLINGSELCEEPKGKFSIDIGTEEISQNVKSFLWCNFIEPRLLYP